MEMSNFSSTHLEGEIMAIVAVGIDLANNGLAFHGVDETGKPALVRPVVIEGLRFTREDELHYCSAILAALVRRQATLPVHERERNVSTLDLL